MSKIWKEVKKHMDKKYPPKVEYIVWLVLNDEDNQEPIPEWYENK